MKSATLLYLVVVVSVLVLSEQPGRGGMDIVRDGVPVATVVVEKPASEQEPAGRRQRGRGPIWDDAAAAKVLVDWIEKITDAKLPVAESPAPGKPAIYVGRAAVKAGLKLDDIQSPSNEGMRIICDGKRVLLGGQNGISTAKAVCRFLETLGCRYFMDHPLGEVYPRTKTLTARELEITDKPGFLYRKIWGSQWGGVNLWKVWNGAGGVPMGTGHSWSSYVPSSMFDEHPEYFALKKAGEKYMRRNSEWLCTSNPEVRKVFAGNVIKAIAAGDTHPSVSPPDGRSYCDCEACKAQDDPNAIELSSGKVSVTNRFVDFFDDVGKRVAEVYPDSVLGFYCYADYTQPPTLERKLSPNLCGWIAPIRYCWLHGIGNPHCKSRNQLKDVIDGWTQYVSKIGYRTYNYNYADCALPFTKLSIWAHDIPYLKSKGCVGINFETLPCWMVYGPHLYQCLRIAYSPHADATAVMDDYYLKFYGAEAGPIMKEFWTAVDKGFQELKCDPAGKSRGLELVHLVYTPKFLSKCQALIDKATGAARGNEAYSKRVAMIAEGLKNAFQYIDVHNATTEGKFADAKKVYDELIRRNERILTAGLTNHYTVKYLQRFLGKAVVFAAATGAPHEVLVELPDVWVYRWDEDGLGDQRGYHKVDFGEAEWTSIPTYSESMTGSGRLKYKTGAKFIWFRTRFKAPKPQGKLTLFFVELTSTSTIYLNGKEISNPGMRRGLLHDRQTFEVDVSDSLREGENVIAIRRQHTWGTLTSKPVMLIQKGE